MKAILCYHKRQVHKQPALASGLIRLSIQQLKELRIGQSSLADDAFYDVLRQAKPFVVWNRNATGLGCLSCTCEPVCS